MPNWLESMEQTFEYYTVNPATLGDVKRLDNVKASSFVRDIGSETLGSATMDIGDSIGESYLRCYLKTIQKGITEKHPLGTVLSQTLPSSFDGKIMNVSMDCYTPLLELKEKKPPLGYTVRKGSRIMDEAYRIIRENARVPVSKVEPIIEKSRNSFNSVRTVKGMSEIHSLNRPELGDTSIFVGYAVSNYCNPNNATLINYDPENARVEWQGCTSIGYGIGFDMMCEQNTTYYVNFNTIRGTVVNQVAFFDGNKNYLTNAIVYPGNGFTTPSNCEYIIVNFRDDQINNSGVTIVENIMITRSKDDLSPYEPYFEPIDMSPTLQYDFVANTDDTWLTFITALISYAKYELDLSEMGHILFSPKQDMASLQPVWEYNDDNSSILYPELTMDRDLYGIPNVVEVIYSYGGYYKRAVAKNEDVNSPTSIQSRGREIPHRETSPNLSGYVTDEQLQAYADQLLRELSTIEYTVGYTHAYCPVRPGDCVRLNYTRAGLNNVKAKVISQNIKCEPGCPVSEKAVFTSKLWR